VHRADRELRAVQRNAPEKKRALHARRHLVRFDRLERKAAQHHDAVRPHRRAHEIRDVILALHPRRGTQRGEKRQRHFLERDHVRAAPLEERQQRETALLHEVLAEPHVERRARELSHLDGLGGARVNPPAIARVVAPRLQALPSGV
jgi:hypothetical protein